MRTEFKDPVGAHRNVGLPLSGVEYIEESFENDDLAGVIFTDCTFRAVNLTNINLEQTLFVNCIFDRCLFNECRLLRSRWAGCRGEGFQITGGVFSEVAMSECQFDKLTIDQSGYQLALSGSHIKQFAFNGHGCEQRDMLISGCEIDQGLAENAHWHGVSAVELDLTVWNLQNARIEQCSLVQMKAEELDLSSVVFARCNLYQSNLKAAHIQSAEGCIFTECNLESLNAKGALLNGMLCSNSKAQKACFDEAELENSMFPKTNLTGASFISAKAKGAVFMESVLDDANLQHIYAYRGSFRNASMVNTQVDRASLVETDLHGVEALLDGADTTDARGTLEWRKEVEDGAKKPLT